MTNEDVMRELLKKARTLKGFTPESEEFLQYLEVDFVPRFASMMGLVVFLAQSDATFTYKLATEIRKGLIPNAETPMPRVQ